MKLKSSINPMPKLGLKIPKPKIAGLAKKGDRAAILAETLGKLRKAKKA